MKFLTFYVVTVVSLGAIPATLYPLFYSRSPWRSTEAGRALMVKAVAIALLFDVSLLLLMLGSTLPPWSVLTVQAVLNTVVVAAVTYQFSVLRRLQRRSRIPHDGQF